jgi:hypothetical protein
MNSSPSQTEKETPTPLAAKPPVQKHHLRIMNSYDVATLTDLSAYPGLTLAVLLTWPTADAIAHWHIT